MKVFIGLVDHSRGIIQMDNWVLQIKGKDFFASLRGYGSSTKPDLNLAGY